MAAMRNLSLVAFATLVFLGGCNAVNQNQSVTPAQAAAQAPIPSTITGSVNLRDPMTIDPGSKLDVKLVDVAQPQIPIAEKTFEVGGQPPFQFSLDLDPTKIGRDRTYVVNVVLTDGERRFLPALNSPVLTGGSGAKAQVVLVPEPTAGEKLKDEFAKLQARIGGMKKVEGTYTTDDASIGWDAFAESGKVRFARVNTDYDKGGRSSVKYAFKDGKPMFVKQQGGATVGWDDNGDVLVNEKSGGGESSDADIQSIHDAAMKAFQLAQDKVDAAKKR
jgi:putative lipoprotein